MTRTRTLVAGGAGFIGSHLVEALLADGHEVVAVDTLITGSRANLEQALRHPCFSLIEADARDTHKLPGRFDLIFHLASPASPVAYQRYPIETLQAGSIVTESLLQRACTDDARFIMASTSEIYGDPAVHPQPESYWGNVSSTGPRSMYDEAKRYAEALVMAYIQSFQVNAGIARIFNTYGPRMAVDDGRVIPAFISAALTGAALPIHGTGAQTRSLCFVSDLVQGLIALAESAEAGPINLGNPHEQNMLQIAERIISLSQSASEITFYPRPQHDPERRCPDITQAQTLLGWAPSVDIDTGLALTIDSYRSVSVPV